MAKPLRPPARPGAVALRRRHRARVLGALVDVCGQLEHLRISREGRAACREVAAMLRSALSGEKDAGRRHK